ncbi:hypothetical protein FA95DRAFT_766747 [Auriscalpium vulgare]|uniref:Uncharacterized protein n=1 Tax=Auriscalpium vulgare TaxID=40419 RepID=A0ACB8RAQ9_9AGAM|nr:hypothetical protein FA95DRAFT_766747 [Auriscalpium vulgare]
MTCRWSACNGRADAAGGPDREYSRKAREGRRAGAETQSAPRRTAPRTARKIRPQLSFSSPDFVRESYIHRLDMYLFMTALCELRLFSGKDNRAIMPFPNHVPSCQSGMATDVDNMSCQTQLQSVSYLSITGKEGCGPDYGARVRQRQTNVLFGCEEL